MGKDIQNKENIKVINKRKKSIHNNFKENDLTKSKEFMKALDKLIKADNNKDKN